MVLGRGILIIRIGKIMTLSYSPFPSLVRNSEPGWLPLSASYGKSPVTGQTGWLVTPRYSVTPLRKGLVFDRLKNTARRRGWSLLSKEILSSDRWAPG